MRIGIVICGSSLSGKSTCVAVLLDSLQELSALSGGETAVSYKYKSISVLAVNNLDTIFGKINDNESWEDGIFTSILKKANLYQPGHKTSTWISFDGGLHDGWCSKLDSIIGSSNVSSFTEAYLESSQTSLMELFCENNKRLLALNYFHKKAPP